MANISNTNPHTQVLGTNDADNIDNFGGGAMVAAYAGEDLIRNFYAPLSTVHGYNGNDTIYNLSDHAVITGDNGNDYIGNIASNVTIMGGADADTVLSDPNIVLVEI